MMRADPLVVAALSDLARGLRAIDVEFCVIGALVPELLLAVRPYRLTKDADAAVVLDSLADFERLKERLSDFGFEQTSRAYRLTHRSGGWVDLLPYSESLAPTGRLELARDLSFNMVGFDQVLPNAIQVRVTSDLIVPVAPLPLYVLLSLSHSETVRSRRIWRACFIVSGITLKTTTAGTALTTTVARFRSNIRLHTCSARMAAGSRLRRSRQPLLAS